MTSVEETAALSDDERDQLVSQLHAHQPVGGWCPLCGVKRCAPRRNAQERLMAAGVDLSRPSPLGEALIETYRAQLRDHTDCDCDLGRAAWQGLMASGVSPGVTS